MPQSARSASGWHQCGLCVSPLVLGNSTWHCSCPRSAGWTKAPSSLYVPMSKRFLLKWRYDEIISKYMKCEIWDIQIYEIIWNIWIIMDHTTRYLRQVTKRRCFRLSPRRTLTSGQVSERTRLGTEIGTLTQAFQAPEWLGRSLRLSKSFIVPGSKREARSFQ